MKPGKSRKPFRPDMTVLVPLFVLFVMTLSGPSIADALRRSLHLFFGGWTAVALWAQVIVLDFALFLYFVPVFRAHLACTVSACAPGERKVAVALRRINRIRSFTIAVSIAVFTAGGIAFQATLRGGLGAFDAADLARKAIALVESSIAGFFVGVFLALQVEDGLYRARRTILAHSPAESLAYSSLYGKTSLIMLAIVLFVLLQALSFASNVFSFTQGMPGAPLAPALVPLAQPGQSFDFSDFLSQTRHVEGLGKLLEVFLFRMVALGLFVFQMLFQLKRLIRKPLETIHERLESLNSPNPDSGKAIEIVQNDEYAAVYRQINALIQKQQGTLEATRRRFEDVVAGAADPIIAFDDSLALRLYNPAAEALFGYPRDAAMGKPLSLFLGDEASRFAAARFAASHTHEDGESLGRFEWRAADGSPRLMESHLSRSGEGADGWTTAILRDVSRQAELEENLRRAKAEAENASTMKSEFLANMSHELRTPLNAILGFTQLLAGDGNLTERQVERIRIISRSGEHLLALINDILDISKIEAGKMELHPAAFDLHDFVGDISDMFDLKCRKKGLSLYHDTTDDLPRYVRGDIGKLRQVMVNLVGNAVKFTAEGGIGILVGVESGSIRFEVRDTGRGIPPSEREAILRPFVQASTTDHEGGTGLGLAISSRYVEMMGGKLEVRSEPGKGSEFSFSIPLEPADEAGVAREPDEVGIRVELGREVTALVADDQEANRLVLKEMLERAGFSVIEAVNGREAIDKAREARPAIAFMDIKMPVMDGYAATEAIKADPALSGMKVFALTASAFSHDAARIEAAGFDGFLAKPFKLGALYGLIAERGGVPLASAVRPPASPSAGALAAQAGRPGIPGEADLRRAALALGPDGISRLSDAASINDFTGLTRLAAEMDSPLSAFSAALMSAANAYDEGALARLLSALGAASRGSDGNGDGDGR